MCFRTILIEIVHIYALQHPVTIFVCFNVQLAIAKDPDAAFFKRLEGLQPCEMSELKAGTHIFAVYGELTYLQV